MKTPAEEAIEMIRKKKMRLEGILAKMVTMKRPVDMIRRKKSQNQRKTNTLENILIQQF